MLYGVVVLDRPAVALKFIQALDTRPAEFFIHHVKSLCLARGISVKQALRILSTCTGLIRLACWTIPNSYASATLLPAISKLGLRQLSLNQKAIPGLENPTFYSYDLNIPSFRDITHLDIVNHWALWSTSVFDSLPRLTHVGFRFWSSRTVAMALRNILSRCALLKVLALLTPDGIAPAAVHFLQHEGLVDPRLVVMSYSRDIQYWEGLERGEPDLWAQAEKIAQIQGVPHETRQGAYFSCWTILTLTYRSRVIDHCICNFLSFKSGVLIGPLAIHDD